MFDFFEKVLGFLESIWSFVLQFVESILIAAQVLTESISLPTFLIGVVPTYIGVSISVIVALAVVKFFIGR